MRRFDQINMIPFIDIMLVLMAVVMTTASFVERGLIEVDLPEATAAQRAAEGRPPIEITIDRHNRLFVDGDAISEAHLEQLLEGRDHRTPVTLRVDRQALFEGFIGVIDRLNRHHFETVSIETRTP